MKITIESEELDSKKVEKTFTLEIEGLKNQVIVEKYWIEDSISGDYDTDWNIVGNAEKEWYEALDDEEKDELDDFINDLS